VVLDAAAAGGAGEGVSGGGEGVGDGELGVGAESLAGDSSGLGLKGTVGPVAGTWKRVSK
jgi:hypothetical protein